MSDQGDRGSWPPPQPTYPGTPAAARGWPPPAYGVAPQPVQYPSFPHAEPTPYHRMQRNWTYAWWKPVVGTLLLFVSFFLVAPLALLPIVLVGAAGGGGDYLDNLMDALSFQSITPTLLLYLNLTLGSMILVTWAINRVVHRMRPRWLSSVMPSCAGSSWWSAWGSRCSHWSRRCWSAR